MAGVIETVKGVTCVYLSVFCPDAPAPPPGNPGNIAPGFYKNVEPPASKAKIPKPAKLVVANNLTFGRVRIGRGPSVLQTVIANGGELALNITALEISGSESFQLRDRCGLIKAGGTCRVNIAFTPSKAGVNNGTLLVGTPGAIKRIPLAGTGVAAPVAKPAPKPLPKPKVVKKRPPPKRPAVVDPAVTATIRSLQEIVSAEPTVYGPANLASFGPASLPANEERWKLSDETYKGDEGTPSFDKAISGFPVERCRIIPTGNLIPLVLDSPINSQICGPVMAHIAHDVYGPDGRIRLLKKGTRVEGACEPLEDADASRIKVEFTKLTRPDGAVIKLAKAQGADAMGQFGLVGEKFDRVFDKYGPTAIASTLGAAVAFATAAETNDDGTTVDSSLSAAGDAFNQNISQIVAEELRNATNRKRRIRVKKGTLIHIKPTNYWYFPNPYQIQSVKVSKIKLTYQCSDQAFKSDEGRRQNPER